jgi:pimeloyl-ACP methyl ester carboxylesterase
MRLKLIWLAIWLFAAQSVAAKPALWLTLPEPRPLPAPAASGYVAHDGARIWWAAFGSGPPVIMLHGGLASSRWFGDQVPALVADHHRVILIDSRGHGRSSRDQRPYTYELMASDVVAVMDVLHLRRAAVVGWSDGAIIGLVMALKDPERLTRVFAFAANMDPSGVKPGADRNPTFAHFGVEAAAIYRRISPSPNGFHDFDAAVEHMWDVEPNYTAADLARITTPTAIVDGDHDEAIKRAHTNYLARSIPGARLIILKDTSHFAFVQAPERFNRAMLAFIDAR